MLSGQRIAVIVPAYDEAPRIGAVLGSIPAFVDRVIVIDDASRDDTAARVQQRCADDGRVVLLRHARNRGVGAALKTGYGAALEDGADAAVVMAGDGQMDPADLGALLAPVLGGQADYAKGNRLVHPALLRAMPWTRRLGNRVLSWLTRIVLGVQVQDSQCGYTAISGGALARLPLAQLWEGYGYPNDLIARLSDAGARIVDVPVRPIYAGEISGVGLRHALAMIPFVIARAALRRLARPRAARLPAAADAHEGVLARSR